MEKPNAATIGISKMASNGANEPLTDLRNLRADSGIPIPRNGDRPVGYHAGRELCSNLMDQSLTTLPPRRRTRAPPLADVACPC